MSARRAQAAVMGPRAIQYRRMVKTLKVLADGQRVATYEPWYCSLSFKLMPGGIVLGAAAARQAWTSNAHRTSTPADWRAPLPTIAPADRRAPRARRPPAPTTPAGSSRWWTR